MKGLTWILAMLVSWAAQAQELKSSQALQRLIQGNQRYVSGSIEHKELLGYHRQALVSKQKPIAAIVGCSDSRVPPEIIFDQGLGDLFIIRVAGNVVGDLELESLHYSVVALKTPLIVVLGHQHCGAVEAVIQGKTKLITNIAALIKPAIALAKTCKPPILNCAVKHNVLQVVSRLKENKKIANMISQGKLQVVGAYYNLESGVVELDL